MKAVEFIKKFGWEYTVNYADYAVNINDLKKYIDAYELVRFNGGLHMAKADCMDLDGFEKTTPYWVKIKQAIALVEEVEQC